MQVLAQDDVLLRHAKHWLVRETIGFLRRTLRRLDVVRAQPVRGRRPRLVLRRHCSSSWRSPPTAPTCSTLPKAAGYAPAIALERDQFRPLPRWSNGLTAPRDALRRRRSDSSSSSRAASASRCAPTRRCGSASSPSRPTTRLGRRDAPRDRGARRAVARRADRHGSEPALRRAGDDGDARSSAACRPGRTGSSSGPTRSARRARSSCSAAAARRSSTGKRV